MARGVAEFLRTELVNTGEYRVVERTKLEKVLSEQKLSMTGVLDESTASEIGRMLGAKLVVTGSVIAMGEIYTINIRMINTASGEIESARSVQCRSEGEIPNACYKIAQQIATGTFETAERREVPTKYKEPISRAPTEKGDYWNVCLRAKLDAKSDINKTLWMGAGCLFPLLTVGAAYIIEPSPPAVRLLGKSPEYVSAYRSCYKKAGKKAQVRNATTGCLMGSAIGCCLFGTSQ